MRLAWWANPSERVELAIVQGKEIIPFVALEMNLDLSKEYRGPAQLVIVRKKGAAQKIEAFDPDKLYAQSATPKPDPKAKPEPVKKKRQTTGRLLPPWLCRTLPISASCS